MASIVVMGPPATGARFTLAPHQREFVIGRSGFCDIVLNKRSVSREHARIFEQRGEYFIVDLESGNGTFVNGRQIRAAVKLADGDRINLYDVPLKFHQFEDAAPPSSGTIPVVGDPASAQRDEASQSRVRANLDNVLDIVQRLGSSLDVDVILPKVLDILFQMFPQAVNGEILLVEANGSLSPRATKHGRQDDSAILTVIPRDRQLSRKALESGTPFIENSEGGDSDSVFESSFSSTMFVPIIGATREPMGIIVLETEESESRFTNDDLSLVSGVATIAAQAIGYARAHEVVVENETTRHHLQTAREIQLRMLPRESPHVPGYSFAQYYCAAQIVGGDAYSYHTFPDGRVMLAVADAVGKGLPASLKIAEFISEIRHCISTAGSLKSAMDYLNKFVCRTDDGFITFCLVVLDPHRHTLSIVNAGHPPPRLRRPDGTVAALAQDRVSFPLGLVDDAVFHPSTVTLNVGDEVILFTDGVNEAFNPENDIFGMERLHQALSVPVANPAERIQSLVADVDRFREGRKPNDDQCILVMQRVGG